MNFVPCVTWVSKGIAKSIPDKLQLSPDELKNIIRETKEMSSQIENIDDISEKDISDEEETSETKISKETDIPIEKSEQGTSKEEDDDFNSRYNMESYDDDVEDQPILKISDVAIYVDNKEDTYITDYDAVEEDDKEDEEDFIIKDSDNLLLVGHIEGDSSVLEIYVFNKEEDTLYVHHDIVLPAYPLALEWLDFHPSDKETGNFVAVGDMTSIIKIWDLDVVDILEPDYVLGKDLKKVKKEKTKLKYHSDAVLSLSWNKHERNILASGSADSSIIIWDLQEAKPMNKLQYHSNKVQSLQWHPFESSFLLSGCTDGVVKLYDCRAPDSECKSWKVEGEIERVAWNLLEPIKFLCSTDKGFVHSVDMKADKIEHSVKAHSEAVTGLDICPIRPNILVTASMDKTINIWDLQKFCHVQTQKVNVGSIYTTKFAPDSELTLAIGGNNRSHSLKIMDLGEVINAGEGKNSNHSETSANPEMDTEAGSSRKIKKSKKFRTSFDNKTGQNLARNQNEQSASSSNFIQHNSWKNPNGTQYLKKQKKSKSFDSNFKSKDNKVDSFVSPVKRKNNR